MGPRGRLWLVLLCCAAVWTAFLPSRGVWAPDEARYAEVTREMASEGRWLLPRLNGDLYTEKPPLFFDLARIAALPTGRVPEWAVKVPSLLAALATLLLTGLIAARLMGPDGAWLAPLLLGTMFKFGWQAQFGQIDMLLTALVTAQLWLGLRMIAGQGRGGGPRAAMALLAFAGILAKGPVGCLLPWLILLAYLGLRRDREGARRLALRWIVPAVILLSALWLLLAGFAAGWDYPAGLILRQSLERYAEPWHHKAPFYYYLGVFWTDGLPYSLLLVPLAALLVRRRAWREPGALLPLVWMGVYLLFFTLSPGKRSVYLLPLFAGQALLLAYGLLNIRLGRWPATGFRRALMVLAAVFAGITAYLLMEAPRPFTQLWPYLVSGGLLLVTACLAAAFLFRAGRIFAGTLGLSAAALLFMALTVLPVVRALDPVKTPRELAETLRPLLARGSDLALYPSLLPSLNFYLETRVRVFDKSERAGAETFLEAGGGHLLLVNALNWSAGPHPRASILLETTVGDESYLLLASPHPPGDPPRRLPGDTASSSL